MKTNFIIPMLTLIFVIGISFANVEKSSDPNTDYILENGSFVPINSELNCGSGTETCQVQFEENGPIYDVYDDDDPTTLKKGDGELIKLWQQ